MTPEQPASPVIIVDGEGKAIDLKQDDDEPVYELKPGAETIAHELGIISDKQWGGMASLGRGRKALVGQYVYDKVDQSARINSQLGKYNRPKLAKYKPIIVEPVIVRDVPSALSVTPEKEIKNEAAGQA